MNNTKQLVCAFIAGTIVAILIAASIALFQINDKYELGFNRGKLSALSNSTEVFITEFGILSDDLAVRPLQIPLDISDFTFDAYTVCCTDDGYVYIAGV